MKLYNGNQLVDVKMFVWTGSHWNPVDGDILGEYELQRVPGSDIYLAGDLEYLLDQVENWRLNRGDYSEDADDEVEKSTIVDELDPDDYGLDASAI